MVKIISLFQRNYDGDRLVRDELVPGAEWVLAGEGTATRKLDGTCVRIKDGKLYRRYDAKHGKTPPEGFEPAQEYDQVTGHMPGWIAVGDGPEDQYHREGAIRLSSQLSGDGRPMLTEWTGELLGPKIQGNPEHVEYHMIVKHGGDPIYDAPRDFEGLKAYFGANDIEGIVWHHEDGRMVKIKGKDFGIKRAVSTNNLAHAV